ALIDNLGNGMVIRLTRDAPAISLATKPVPAPNPDSIFFPQQKIGDQICSTFVVKNTAAIGGAPLLINSAVLRKNDPAFAIRSITPPLPYVLPAQQSIEIDLCYTAKDSARHRDSLLIQTDCFSIPVSLDAHGLTGLISASDLNFGIMVAGDTSCKTLQIKNIGSAPFTVTKPFILSDTINFTVDTSGLPAQINPGSSVNVTICFHPAKAGTYSGTIDWSTDLDPSFAHSVKNRSTLSGSAIPKAGVKSAVPELSFSLRPNPSTGNSVIVNLNGEAFLPSENPILSMFDVLGREVYHENISPDMFHIEIPVRDLPQGVYFVRLSSRSGSVTERFVKGR
ncbi:MAG: choice-of-anchor D domain-containing protein, partial [Candidatus Kapaibacterium sp.]